MYIHQYSAISPQQTFENIDLEILHERVGNKLTAREPAYTDIPRNILRRMGKAIRMGIGAAMPVFQEQKAIEGIIIGTANGGMEDCIKFLNQIIDYKEGLLTPGNFVQSTPNAIAAQMGLMQKNKGYNITHVHRGLAFENALLDALMITCENKQAFYLLGAVEEISTYNFNIDLLDGCFKQNPVSNRDLYHISTPGTIAGEGAAMFLVSHSEQNAIAAIQGLEILHGNDEQDIKTKVQDFLHKHLPAGEKADVLFSGENGDSRLVKYYDAIESLFDNSTSIARFKHMCGDYATASSIALWMACSRLSLPYHMIKRKGIHETVRNIVIYNNYRGLQHGIILVRIL